MRRMGWAFFVAYKYALEEAVRPKASNPRATRKLESEARSQSPLCALALSDPMIPFSTPRFYTTSLRQNRRGRTDNFAQI